MPATTPFRSPAASPPSYKVARTVKLTGPVPVVVLYTTAMVDTDGKLHFAPDIYGHDAKLERALDAR